MNAKWPWIIDSDPPTFYDSIFHLKFWFFAFDKITKASYLIKYTIYFSIHNYGYLESIDEDLSILFYTVSILSSFFNKSLLRKILL